MSEGLKQALDLSLFWEYRLVLLHGLLFNVLVFLCAAALALGVGLGAALLRVNRHVLPRCFGTLHVELFRNAPDYIMLVWVHFVLPLLIAMVIRRRIEFHPFASAVIALGFVYRDISPRRSAPGSRRFRGATSMPGAPLACRSARS